MSEETVITNQEPTAENTDPEIQGTEGEEEPTLLGPEETDSPEGKEDAGETPKAEPPEKYEIKVPEGMELDETTLDLFTPIFKELGITNEGAQKLVDAYVPLVQSMVDKQKQEAQAEYKNIVDGWKSDTMKELGATAKEDLAACGRALNKFGSKELRELMQETGVGNHKELVKFMVKIGKTISEDSMGGPQGEAHTLDLADPKRMYPSMPQ